MSQENIRFSTPLPDAISTVSEIIRWATAFLYQKSIPNARLDAEILVAHALRMERTDLYLSFDRPFRSDKISLVKGYLIRRLNREPIQYITGSKEFFGLKFTVSPSVLIPRPETEQLVEKAVQFLGGISCEERNVLDLGTGSGCIAISIVSNVSCQVWAVDISREALETAKNNAACLNVFPFIYWRFGNWFKALKASDPSQFSIITCNPPYLADYEKEELSPEVRQFEPLNALFSGKSGLEAYKELSAGLWNHLKPGGKAYLELHAYRSKLAMDLFKNYPWKSQEVFRDFQGLPRLLVLEKPSIS